MKSTAHVAQDQVCQSMIELSLILQWNSGLGIEILTTVFFMDQMPL